MKAIAVAAGGIIVAACAGALLAAQGQAAAGGEGPETVVAGTAGTSPNLAEPCKETP